MHKKITLSTIDTQIPSTIRAVQYDTDRQLDCYFDDIELTGLSAARLYALKPDGTEVYSDCTINDGYITAPLDSQTLAVVGTVKCQIQLTFNGWLTTYLFNVVVDESLVSSSAIESSNEYSALETALDEVQTIVEQFDNKVNKTGDTMSGNLDMDGNKVTGLATPTDNSDAATKQYVDENGSSITVDDHLSPTSTNPVENRVITNALDDKVSKNGDTLNGVFYGGGFFDVVGMTLASGNSIGNVPIPQADGWVANKKYVDDNDALNEKLANKVTGVLDNTATDTQYPSAKSVLDTLLDYDNYVTNTYEELANKVVTIDNQSTDDEYPSAKCAYDNLALKEDLTNKVTAFSSPTDTEYPSAKLVDDSLALKENVANKVTSISSASTDTEYPTAKAVQRKIGEYRLHSTITADGTANSYTISGLKARSVYVLVDTAVYTATSAGRLTAYYNNISQFYTPISNAQQTSARRWSASFALEQGLWHKYLRASTATGDNIVGALQEGLMIPFKTAADFPYIDKVDISVTNSGHLWASGTKLYVYVIDEE